MDEWIFGFMQRMASLGSLIQQSNYSRIQFLIVQAIAKWEDVPIFDSEEAEAGFWAEYRPDLRLMETAVAGNSEGAESVTITLRIDPRMLARIKRLARSRFLNYQSMMKQWISERMEHEVRER